MATRPPSNARAVTRKIHSQVVFSVFYYEVGGTAFVPNVLEAAY
jgi:hypothetical protein